MDRSELHPAWFILAKMTIHLHSGKGIRLSRDELATLRDSPIGDLMAASYGYGVATDAVEPDPRLGRSAKLALLTQEEGR